MTASNIIEIRSHQMNRRRKKSQPSKPRQVVVAGELRTGPDSWGVSEDALALPANADVDVSQGRTVEGKRAVRHDIFERMLRAPSSKLALASYEAVRRLQGDMALLHQTQGTCDAVRVTGSGAMGALAVISEDFSLARVQAGHRIDAALEGMAEALIDRHALNRAEGAAKRAGRLNRETVDRLLPMARAQVVASLDPRKPAPSHAKLMRDLCEAQVINGRQPNVAAIVTRHTGEKDRHRRGELVRQACDDLAESYRRIDNAPREKVA